MHTLLYQYLVLPSKTNELYGKITGALATVIVFADSDEVGRSRSSRFIARQQWEIEQFCKVVFMGPQQIENLSEELSIVHKRAEKFGIAICFESRSVARK